MGHLPWAPIQDPHQGDALALLGTPGSRLLSGTLGGQPLLMSQPCASGRLIRKTAPGPALGPFPALVVLDGSLTSSVGTRAAELAPLQSEGGRLCPRPVALLFCRSGGVVPALPLHCREGLPARGSHEPHTWPPNLVSVCCHQEAPCSRIPTVPAFSKGPEPLSWEAPRDLCSGPPT